MSRVAKVLRSSADWPIRASYFRFRLSPGQPFHARVSVYPRPTPLSVSIHEGFEVGIVLAGGYEMHRDDRVLLGRPGDMWLLGMWEPHRWRVTKPRTQQVVVIFFPEFLGEDALPNASWLGLFACPPEERPSTLDPDRRKTVLGIGRELRQEIEQKGPHWEVAVRLLLIRLLFVVSRDWRGLSSSQAGWTLHRPALARVMPALAAIHAQPAARVTLAEAAASCRLSAAQFSRVFRQTMGLSFAKFRLRSRLAFAARLLLTTDLPVEAAAGQAGFVDASHLYRHFLEHYGATPGQYREQGRR